MPLFDHYFMLLLNSSRTILPLSPLLSESYICRDHERVWICCSKICKLNVKLHTIKLPKNLFYFDELTFTDYLPVSTELNPIIIITYYHIIYRSNHFNAIENLTIIKSIHLSY